MTWLRKLGRETSPGSGVPNVDPNNKYTPYDQLYPGNAYVDWTCLDGYNKDGTNRSRALQSELPEAPPARADEADHDRPDGFS